MERTLVILKPDAVRRRLVGEIISRFERKNLEVSNAKVVTIDRETAEEHYNHIKQRPFFCDIINYIIGGPSIVLVLSGEQAVSIVRNMIGKANALDSLPGSIRGDYGVNACENLVHASDSLENARIEIDRFFADKSKGFKVV